MGLFDFVLGKGRKLEVPAPQPQAQTGADLEALKAVRRAEALAKLVRDLDLKAENLDVAVQGTTAVVRGRVASQAEREKIVLALGNVEWIDKVDDRLEVPTPAAAAVFYTVQPGDTLSKIAKVHYGKAGAYMKIFEANKPLLTDPDKIYPGQVLRIPDATPPTT